MLHAGMDIHKRFSVLTVTDDSGKELVSGKRLGNEGSEILAFFNTLGEEVRVVLEAGPNWQWMCDLLDDHGREIESAEKRVGQEYRGSQDAMLLSTMPGIGPILSLTILSEIGDIARFRTAKQLSSYAGLCPSTAQSGGRVRHGGITRQGSRLLRWALVEAAVHACSYPGPLRDFYLRLKRRKGNKVARVAVARRISTYVFWMLKEKKTFEDIVFRLASDLG